jgi:hypothetical protein
LEPAHRSVRRNCFQWELAGRVSSLAVENRFHLAPAQPSVSRPQCHLSRGGSGEGRVTSQPPGIDCTFTRDGTTGTCGNAFFPAGTEVRLEARAATGSQFRYWEFEVSCPDAPKVTVQAGVAHICRPVFDLR